MRRHWSNCITHFDTEVEGFIQSYFGEQERQCLLVAAAGFDPRSQRIATMLANVLGPRLSGIFIREERGQPDPALRDRANDNAKALKALVPNCEILDVEVFGDDGAAIGGPRIAATLGALLIDPKITDIVLDMSALSIGIGFPAAKLLLSECETVGRSFHLLIVSNPELDDNIVSEPADRPMPVKGFSGSVALDGLLDPARIWIPQLAKGRKAALTKIGLSVGECYKICPVVPFPARDPRRADGLISEYENELVNEWQVDPRDLVYVSERNPLDCYRTLSTLKQRYDKTVSGSFEPRVILSPIGSKVMAAGALMAAIEHDLTVQYLETVRYEFNAPDDSDQEKEDMMVHVLLSGPAYGDYDALVRTEEI
ncbi:hypothetical protein DEA98_10775 [Brucella pseudogrignonensis]|uniref:Uncharacterized protein n=1 Tax=Brucella pseudogrignonensis TaxID=419475 RepID=A0A256GDS5_9HYPH|nr:hypothetical protein [Brucella pseudogrignonensis]MCM0751653.1 hypothetical protein [Brucella pseudogrignonensis]NNV21973.1 hypothetical protein [Brucella pseudogrignonensis]OYR25304.1 hypothetical protein CEV34_3028 [Brucella pseudogrignonensis]